MRSSQVIGTCTAGCSSPVITGDNLESLVSRSHSEWEEGSGKAYLGRRARSRRAAAAAPGAGTPQPLVPGTAAGGGSLLAASLRLRAARGSGPCAVPRSVLAVSLRRWCALAGLGRGTDSPARRELLNLADTWAEAVRAPG